MLCNTDKKEQIESTWLVGSASCTLIIPKAFAIKYGIDEPSKVVVEGRDNGILIRKIEL